MRALPSRRIVLLNAGEPAGARAETDPVRGRKRPAARPTVVPPPEADPPGATKSEDGPPRPPSAPPSRGQGDQLRAILAKSLDLAEAGLSLGLTLINRVGSAAQQHVFDRAGVAPEPRSAGGAETDPRHAGDGDSPLGPAAPEISVPDTPLYCITNRLPLAPGGSVKVSFSINNDSVAAPKRVRVRIEGFAGETEGGALDGQRFAVKPTRMTIAPMDFGKFVLLGTVPPDVAPDVYSGWIIVTAGNEFRIPVRLVVFTP